MNQNQPKKHSGQVQTSVALRDDRDSDYDTSTTAWAAFDRQMTCQITQLEQQLRRYFTPTACRKDLGR
ncbi:MAG TPA: hypothetical protein VFB96_14685 [Pirellulaceae bacterium]|jgi:hypothetical protein|nr:hypothetical protein [Pirellulaceae bacterium]